jgi:hypothetical protein
MKRFGSIDHLSIECRKIEIVVNSKIWHVDIMPTSIEKITKLLPQASESVLQEVWTILSTAVKNEESSSEPEKTLIRNHSAFLNGYAPEDEGLYDDY